jgi:hypothetical protein
MYASLCVQLAISSLMQVGALSNILGRQCSITIARPMSIHLGRGGLAFFLLLLLLLECCLPRLVTENNDKKST